MNPNAGEPVNPPGAPTGDKPINPVSGVISEPSVTAPSTSVGPDMSSDLSDLQNLVNAAKEQVPTNSQSAFVKQFGPAEGANPVSQPTSDLNAGLDSSSPVSVQVEEKPEPSVAETPAEKLKEQIAASIDTFLVEVTKEKIPA